MRVVLSMIQQHEIEGKNTHVTCKKNLPVKNFYANISLNKIFVITFRIV